MQNVLHFYQPTSELEDYLCLHFLRLVLPECRNLLQKNYFANILVVTSVRVLLK